MTERVKALASEIVRPQRELDREIESRRKSSGYAIRERITECASGI